jgi:hypothetical protein
MRLKTMSPVLGPRGRAISQRTSSSCCRAAHVTGCANLEGCGGATTTHVPDRRFATVQKLAQKKAIRHEGYFCTDFYEFYTNPVSFRDCDESTNRQKLPKKKKICLSWHREEGSPHS